MEEVWIAKPGEAAKDNGIPRTAVVGNDRISYRGKQIDRDHIPTT
jgi:hypothetical protein